MQSLQRLFNELSFALDFRTILRIFLADKDFLLCYCNLL